MEFTPKLVLPVLTPDSLWLWGCGALEDRQQLIFLVRCWGEGGKWKAYTVLLLLTFITRILSRF